jgi:(1->4)-alpha-D-glucan 1-alpha-D-glucosylmutase
MATRFPRSTYRLQFSPEFRLRDACRVVEYLDALGVRDVYASPLFKARRGSLHGYDVTDHAYINPDLGRMADFKEFANTLRERGMGLVLDVVPNHMGIADDANTYWQDVLENGPSSRFATFFDIDWQPPKPDLAGKVLLPFLGDQYGRVLENGELRLAYARGAFWIRVYDRRLPAEPCTWVRILEPALEAARPHVSPHDADIIELESILTSLRRLPARTETGAERVTERHREKEVAKRRLARLLEDSRPIRSEIDRVIERFNGRRGDPRSFDELESLLADQAYRLSFWRVASDEINYRRFFDINELAAIRVEELEVFDMVHTLVLQLVRDELVTGLRIDHPDGLLDPEQYFRDLQEACRRASAERREEHDAQRVASGAAHGGRAAPGRTADVPDAMAGGDAATDRPFFVVVEKILSSEERLDLSWAVHGTTGYEFLNALNGIFVQRENSHRTTALYKGFTGRSERYEDTMYRSKRVILDVSMSGELRVLSRYLDRISEQHRWARDFTLASLRGALREVIACFPVYRTYIRADTQTVSDEARRHVETAIAGAKRRNPVTNESLFDFIRTVLLLDDPPELHEAQRAARREFVMRFQQLTAPVTARGIEDTAFYRSHALSSLNEVGGEPERFGVTMEEFHGRNAERQAHWPRTMTSTSTHDTKRSEDVRARINVLSEIPDEWQNVLERWRRWNRPRKIAVDGLEVPDANEEYLFYQTLLGVWPLQLQYGAGGAEPALVRRLQEYMVKASREAKLHTSWLNTNAAHEEALRVFVRNVMTPNPDAAFLGDVQKFVDRVAPAGAVNALAQLVLKMTSPGAPDVYQGTELWNLRLVDPDNRRPVDFTAHAALLAELQARAAEQPAALVRDLIGSWRDGRIKMYLTYKSLHRRRDNPHVLERGDYVPLEAHGARKQHVCAFARRYQNSWVVAAVPRLTAHLSATVPDLAGESVWEDTALLLPRTAPDTWTNVYSDAGVRTQRDDWGVRLPLAQLFAELPVAWLEAESGAT